MSFTGRTIRCIIVGDENVGKTSLLITYQTNKFPEIYVPTILDSSAVNVKIKNKTYTLGLFEFNTALDQNVAKADVFLLCFSLNKLSSLQNIENKWYPMMQSIDSNAKFILVGMKSDLKDSIKDQIISIHAKDIANKLNLSKYVECSAKTLKGIKQVFDEAILACLNQSDRVNYNYINPLKKVPKLTFLNKIRKHVHEILYYIEILIHFTFDLIHRTLNILSHNGQ